MDDQFDEGGAADADVEADAPADVRVAPADLDGPTDDGGGWSPPEPTGVEQVDGAIRELVRLDQLPTSEHVAVFDGVHRSLQDSLADLDES
ncbi:MAG: hypothetical protein QOJ62_2014 [Actinomycetota bacterium]|jgi:hypothetical protein|nr:hypothetical protein [Actinomycetota bacterium]